MSSLRWLDLSREVLVLRDQFLPTPFDPLGVYPDPTLVQAKTRAFLVLSHAEIESFLEDWAKDLARTAETAWTTAQRLSLPLLFLAASARQRVEHPPILKAGDDVTVRLNTMIKRTCASHYKAIKDNHGVKEANVLALLSPLGVPGLTIGTKLLADLTSLGGLRGDHAHQAARSVQSVSDPETQFNMIAAIIKDLGPLDQWLGSYKEKI